MYIQLVKIPNNKTRLRFINGLLAQSPYWDLRAPDHRGQSQMHELCMDNFYMLVIHTPLLI